ncbi:MAG TPA: class I SAM-dependent methyltransferase [Phycisphaerae bacterium]|nr:class I SAM-dependent methyltransferase [Phycisphaerae bacterium]HNU47113.1 class I SAM-dependent methyltransferase [Phycisphaerae bacterium]
MTHRRICETEQHWAGAEPASRVNDESACASAPATRAESPRAAPDEFLGRFATRAQAKRYRDRYATGRRVRTNAREQAALGELLAGLGHLPAALDLPCGTGRFAATLADFADRIILADASDAMLDTARQGVNQFHPQYLQCDASQVSLDDGSVDLVFCHRFLHHVYDPNTRAQILNELVRVTRRYLVLPYYSPGQRDYRKWLTRFLTGRKSWSERPLRLRRFLEESRGAGLRIARQKILRRFPVTGVFFLFEKP